MLFIRYQFVLCVIQLCWMIYVYLQMLVFFAFQSHARTWSTLTFLNIVNVILCIVSFKLLCFSHIMHRMGLVNILQLLFVNSVLLYCHVFSPYLIHDFKGHVLGVASWFSCCVYFPPSNICSYDFRLFWYLFFFGECFWSGIYAYTS